MRHRMMPEVFSIERLHKARTVYEFDDVFTAPGFGFQSADHYYSTQSSGAFLDLIRVPALLIQAADDPMIPFEVFDHPAFTLNPNLRLEATVCGGHLGFLNRVEPRFWCDGAVVDWIGENLPEPS